MKKLAGYPSIDKPWLKYYSKEQITYKLPRMSIYEYLYRENQDYLKEPALIYFNHKMSFEQFFFLIDEFAGALKNYGIAKGDIVAICMPNTPEAVIAFYAINRIGAIADMLHPLASANEIKDCLIASEARLMILIDMDFNKVQPIIAATKVEKIIVASVSQMMPFYLKKAYHFLTERKYHIDFSNASPYIYWNTFVKEYKQEQPVFEPILPGDMAVFFHTGGTTGVPKAVMLTNDNFNSSITQIQVDNDIVTRGEKLIAVMPIFHGFGSSNCVHLALCSGVAAVLMPKYNPKMFERIVTKQRVNHILGVPMIFESILNNHMFKGKDLNFFRYLISGGDKLKGDIEEAFQVFLKEHNCKEPLLKAYGLTEAVAATTRTRRDINAVDSVGIPFIKNNYKVVKIGTNEEVGYNVIGELCISGPSVMQGYYKNEKETEQVLKKDKHGNIWLHTGDMGYIDQNGIIYYSQRKKRMIITNGYNVYPTEIEAVLERHIAVKQCVVVGIRHIKKSEVAVAFIILKKENLLKSQEVLLELQELCKSNLPQYAIPEKIVIRKEFPMTLMNKINYLSLIEEYETQNNL